MMFSFRSGGFRQATSNNVNGLAQTFGPPKAEVTGSNPVGCANDFNSLVIYLISVGVDMSALCQLAGSFGVLFRDTSFVPP